MFSKKRGITAAVVAMALTLTACSGGSDSSTTESGSGEINLGVAYETTNYNPTNTSSALAKIGRAHV